MFLLLGIILITTLTSVIFFVVSLLWMAMMHRFLAPPLHAGSEFEHWSWTWLWRATIIDTTRNLVPCSFKGTYLAAWACKLCGMHIGRDVVIDVGLDVLLAGPVVPSLVEIGDDVLIEDLALINNIECPDGMTYTVRPVTIGHRATILLKGYVHPGTRVGDGATVGIMAFAQGDVPPNAVVRNSEVLDGQLRHTDPAVAAICITCAAAPCGCGKQRPRALLEVAAAALRQHAVATVAEYRPAQLGDLGLADLGRGEVLRSRRRARLSCSARWRSLCASGQGVRRRLEGRVVPPAAVNWRGVWCRRWQATRIPLAGVLPDVEQVRGVVVLALPCAPAQHQAAPAVFEAVCGARDRPQRRRLGRAALPCARCGSSSALRQLLLLSRTVRTCQPLVRACLPSGCQRAEGRRRRRRRRRRTDH